MNEKAWSKKEVIENYLRMEELILPHKEIQRQLICDLAKVVFPDRSRPLKIVDLGCGYGGISKRLVAAYPNSRLVCLDISKDMLALAAENYKDSGERVEYHCLDFARRDRFVDLAVPVDVVVSGMAIHHLAHPAKKELFSEIYQILDKPGLFLNMDKVLYETETLRDLEERVYLEEMAVRKSEQTGQNWGYEEIADYYYNRPDAADDIVLDLPEQLGYLREAGFTDVGTFFRYLKFVVFGAVK